MWKALLLDFGSRPIAVMSNCTSLSLGFFPLKLWNRNKQTRGTLYKTLFLFSEQQLDAYFRFLFYWHRRSQSGCWSSGSQYNLDHHQGNTLLLLRTVSGYVSASALFFRPAVIFYLLYFCVLTSQHHFGFLTVERLKYTRVVFSCVLGVWLTEFAEFIFTSWGKRYECLRCHWPLTCPAGWKGFLTHPSHASALQSIRGAGHRQGRPGIWIPPHLSTRNICWRTEEGTSTETPPCQTSICCKSFEYFSRDF